MIYVDYCGRCGNQMFMYAIAHELKKLYNEDIIYNDYILKNQGRSDESFRDYLHLFNVEPMRFITEKNMIRSYGSFSQRFFCTLYDRLSDHVYDRLPRPRFYEKQTVWQPFLNRYGIHRLVRGYSPIVMSSQKNKFIRGYFENEEWFKDIKDELKVAFKPKNPSSNNKKFYESICNQESVCVSVRRGDFLNERNCGLRDICDENYYRRAIDVIKYMYPNATFFFFSDDIEWVKNYLNFDVVSYYETGQDDVAEKMRLMSACKHFIMSNSTFCWWAQYLSDNTDKTVISPDRWFNMDGYKHDLIGDDWILIECDKQS